MQVRITVLIFITFLTLSACSLSDDVTPPPGYQSPTFGPTLVTASQTIEPTLTKLPATAIAGSIPAGMQSPIPSATIITTSGLSLSDVNGSLTNGSGGSIPNGQKVTLIGFDKDQSGNYQKVIEMEAPVNPDGSYSFKGVDTPLDRAFLIVTSWGGVEYQSDPVVVSASTVKITVPITVYEKTVDLNTLALNQVHLIFDLSTLNVVKVTELFIVTNPGKQVVYVPSDGKTIPFINTPADSSNVQFQLSQGSAQLLNATGGFALLPGAEKQYGFIASYSMPYGKNLKFNQPFSMPVSSLTVFVPQGVRLRGEQLTDAGPQTIQSQIYEMYQANNLVSGSSLLLTLSGKPGLSTGFKLDRQTLVLIGIGVVGVLLIGLGIFLYLRDRKRYKKEIEIVEAPVEVDALGEDRDNIMDAVIALDDQFKAGELPKEAYEKRAMELKERLKGVI
jgi:hypothetical protein